MKSWDEIRALRRETRAKLLARRLAVRLAERERIGGIITRLLRDQAPELWTGCIGFCFMRRNNQRLYRLARGILRSRSEAEDVVQEAYVRCCKLARIAWSVLARGRGFEPTFALSA